MSREFWRWYCIDDLIQKREALRNEEKEITQEIKIERARIKQEKGKIQHAPKGVDYAEYLKIVKENKRLRGLIALLRRTDEKTYEKVGEFIGVSGSRAREIIKREMQILRWLDSEI